MRSTIAALFLIGCGAHEPAPPTELPTPMDRLEGEWWYQASVEAIDGEAAELGITAPWVGALIHGDARIDAPVLGRVRWQAFEDHLVALRVGEDHAPVVAFPILEHLDESGRQARPWEDRSQVRVDWSRQLLATPGLFGPGLANHSSSPRWRREPLRIDSPAHRDASGYLERSAEELWTALDSGATLRVRLRHRFWRIPEDHAFVGATLDDAARDAFPIFRTETAMRFRHRLGVPVLTTIPCEHDHGCASSRCDRDAHVCRSRPAERGPIRLVLSAGYPAHLRRGAFEAVAQWNDAFMRARRILGGRGLPSSDQLVECQPDPTRWCFSDGSLHSPEVLPSIEYCASRRDHFLPPNRRAEREEYDCWIAGPDEPDRPRSVEGYADGSDGYRFEGEECALVLELNPCDVGADECVEAGDPRHTVVQYATDLRTCGVAQPRMDPITGEAIGGALHVGASCLETLAAEATWIGERMRPSADIVEYPERFDGYARWLQASVRGDEMIPAPDAGFSGRELRTSPYERGWDADPLGELSGTPLEDLFHGFELDVLARLARERRRGSGPLELPSLDRDAIADRVSTFRNGPLRVAREEDERRRLLAAHLVFEPRWAHFAPGGAHEYWSRALHGPDARLRWEQMLHRAMVTRLVGHVLGLIPNLAASLDEAHYPPAYRVADALERLPHREGEAPARTDADLERRAVRRALRRRSQRGIGHVSSSSVLDLHGDLSDLSGVGSYDEAAVLFSYFDLREEASGRGVRVAYGGGEACRVDEDCPHGPSRGPLPPGQDPQRCIAEVCEAAAFGFETYAACHPMDAERVDCSPFDAGSSLYEAVHHYRDRWLELYPRTHAGLAGAGPPAVTPIAVAALMRIARHAHVDDRWPGDTEDATREAFAWLVELLTRPALEHPYFEERALVLDGAIVDTGLGYERLVALNALTARTFDGEVQRSFFDRFEHSRAPVLHGIVTGHPERFAPRSYVHREVGGTTGHATFPDPRVETWLDATTLRPVTIAPRVDELYGPADGAHLADGGLRVLAAIHAYAESPPFADGSRRAWVWRLDPSESWAFPRADPCAHGRSLPGSEDPACDAVHADYAVYESEVDGASYAASAHPVGPAGPSVEGLPEPGYELLVDLIELQRTGAARHRIASAERVLEALIETQRLQGVRTWLPPE